MLILTSYMCSCQVDDDDKSDVDDDDMEVAGADVQAAGDASKAGQETVTKQNKSVRMSVVGKCCLVMLSTHESIWRVDPPVILALTRTANSLA